MPDWGLLVPFLDDSKDFALGAEVGMLFEQMKEANHVQNYILLDNQEQITLMANRLGWRVTEMRPWKDSWFWCVLDKI